MYIFNKVTVNPQLPKSIEKLGEISENLWWSWNTEFLKIFKAIDIDLWERCGKNPVKFLKQVEQEKLEKAAQNPEILRNYRVNVDNFESYMKSRTTWFSKQYPENKDDVIAYFSAEYGLDETLPIYAGGLGILSGDHLKSASDLGLPIVAIGLLYKNGYFNQKINRNGEQVSEYYNVEMDNLPIKPLKDENGEDVIVNIKLQKDKLYIKVWKICVGRVNLYLLDTDIPENKEEYRGITLKLYGGNQEMRIRQEMVLGIGGVKVLQELGINPKVYHMNEGHSSFLVLEALKDTIREKEISFQIAKDIVTAKTVFTTHTPVPAGNDIFPTTLVEKYFDGDIDVSVTIRTEGAEQIAEMAVKVKQDSYRAVTAHKDMYASIDKDIDILEGQIRKWKTKKDKANKEDSIKALNNLPAEGAIENEIIKTIYYDLKPMTAEDAKLKLQEKPQDRFITFINQDTNKVNVLFKMKDNKNFGLVEPEA